MENYIVINGQKMELTKEQMEKLGIQENKENPFERKICEKFYYIIVSGMVNEAIDNDTLWDVDIYRTANYCRDKKLMQQRALHETLDRLLWRFACENGELENPWDNKHYHYMIYYQNDTKEFLIDQAQTFHHHGVYFSSYAIAQRAIEEIVIPFIEKNPDFVW